jgi:quinolinate synthase
MLAAEPETELFVHPECGCTTNVMWLLGEGELPADRTKVLSTGGMVTEAERRAATASSSRRDGHPASAAEGQPTKEFVPVDRKASAST